MDRGVVQVSVHRFRSALPTSGVFALALGLPACGGEDPEASSFTTTIAPSSGDTTAAASEHGDDAQDTSSGGEATSSGAVDPEDTGAAETSSGQAESNGTETTDATEESTGGEPACPANGPPPGTAVRKFDVATLSCGMGQLECPSDDDQCFCAPHFASLNVGPSHFIATGSDNNKELVWAAGNFQSVYVNDLNTNWPAGGQARADTLMADLEELFDCGIPEWFIVNEISAGLWPDDPAYRDFVIEFATAMDVDYDKSVVIAAPFDTPGNHASDWNALADHAFVGAEVYLSGKEVNGSGNSVSWCRGEYQDAVDAYGALGVPLSRLFLVEHFGQTESDKTWGRAGVSAAGWHNAIEARSAASHDIDFAGYVSYAWSWNLMHDTDANRLAFQETYVAQDLP